MAGAACAPGRADARRRSVRRSRRPDRRAAARGGDVRSGARGRLRGWPCATSRRARSSRRIVTRRGAPQRPACGLHARELAACYDPARGAAAGGTSRARRSQRAGAGRARLSVPSDPITRRWRQPDALRLRVDRGRDGRCAVLVEGGSPTATSSSVAARRSGRRRTAGAAERGLTRSRRGDLRHERHSFLAAALRIVPALPQGPAGRYPGRCVCPACLGYAAATHIARAGVGVAPAPRRNAGPLRGRSHGGGIGQVEPRPVARGGDAEARRPSRRDLTGTPPRGSGGDVGAARRGRSSGGRARAARGGRSRGAPGRAPTRRGGGRGTGSPPRRGARDSRIRRDVGPARRRVGAARSRGTGSGSPSTLRDRSETDGCFPPVLAPPSGPASRGPRPALVLEPGDEIPAPASARPCARAASRGAPLSPVARPRHPARREKHVLRRASSRWAGSSGDRRGAPARVERLVAASGARIVHHASSDHARFQEDDLSRALERGFGRRGRGAHHREGRGPVAARIETAHTGAGDRTSSRRSTPSSRISTASSPPVARYPAMP
jgi:hypothetical protein